MREYVIFTDSSADFDQKMVSELGVEVLPLKFSIGGKTYANWPDNREISPADFYAQLRGGEMSTTSQVNVSDFTDAFRKLIEDGKDILYVGFSSGLSGTVNSGQIAAEELRGEFPDANIVVVDTLAASLGQGLLVWHASQLKQQGKTITEVAEWLEANKLSLAHWFTVDDMNFLKRGGRVSGATAALATILNIKPIMHVDNEGHLVAVGKVRGRRKSIDTLLEHMADTVTNAADQQVFISHGDCLEEAQYLASEIQRRLGVKKPIYLNNVGPVIGSHSGPGTMALFFMASKR